MEEVKDIQDETIETLLTDDYDDEKHKKQRAKAEKKRKKIEKKNQKKSKKKSSNISLTDEEMKKQKSNMKKIVFFVLVIAFLLVAIAIEIMILIPKIKLNGDKNIKVEFGSHYQDPGCTATYLGKNISNKIWYEGEVDEEKLGTYFIVCKIRKNRLTVSAERNVEIVDTKEPEITLEGDQEKVICPNNEYEEEGYKAIDNYDGDITDKVVITKNENDVTYSITDTSGNEKIVKRNIIKEDKEAPTIELKGNEKIYVTVGGKYNESLATATDNCDDDLTESIKIDGSVDTNKEGTYTLTYSVSDNSGNTSSKERKVIVQKATQKVSSSLGCGAAGTIYLTFDDGPNNNYTPTILNVLKKYGVKATFFVTGSGSDSLIQREYDEGHAIGVHTWTHDYGQIYASSDAFWSDFNKVQSRIKKITGSETKIMRFPGGASNAVSKIPMSQLANEAIEKGYNYIDWNVSSGDSGGTTDPTVECKNVTGSLSKSRGNVVLMHDIKKHTMNAIECIVKYGVDNGYSFAKLDSSVICRHATKK